MTSVRNAAAEAIAYAVTTYRDNDPADAGDSQIGLGRRIGRRDACAGLVAVIMNVTPQEAHIALKAMAARE